MVAAVEGEHALKSFRNVADDEAFIGQFLCVHFPHKFSPLIREILGHQEIVRILTRIIGPNVKAMQSMLFIKSPGTPGQAWHQDESFIPTRDRSLAAAWIALDDATKENGCLWAIPSSHAEGVLWPLREHDNPEFDSIPESHGFPFDSEMALPVEVSRGTVVFFHGYLLHRSFKNRSAGFRRVLVNHYMSAESLLPWHMQEGIQAQSDYRDVTMVAGEDPYAYKGTQDLSKPFIRSARRGTVQ